MLHRFSLCLILIITSQPYIPALSGSWKVERRDNNFLASLGKGGGPLGSSLYVLSCPSVSLPRYFSLLSLFLCRRCVYVCAGFAAKLVFDVLGSIFLSSARPRLAPIELVRFRCGKLAPKATTLLTACRGYCSVCFVRPSVLCVNPSESVTARSTLALAPSNLAFGHCSVHVGPCSVHFGLLRPPRPLLPPTRQLVPPARPLLPPPGALVLPVLRQVPPVLRQLLGAIPGES